MGPEPSMDERVTDLEIKLTHQEHTIETLNQVVLEQGERLQALARRLEQALERYAATGESPDSGDVADERPPHY